MIWMINGKTTGFDGYYSLPQTEIAFRCLLFTTFVTPLAGKRSAGVTPEVNLRNSLREGDGFGTQRRRHQKFKTGVSVAKKGTYVL